MQRRPRQIDPDHLAFIRTLSCVACGDDTSTEAAHIRFAERRAGKRQTGKGERPDDCWSLPLCGRCHRKQHEVGEINFWSSLNIDPVFLALALYRVGVDAQIAEEIIREWRRC